MTPGGVARRLLPLAVAAALAGCLDRLDGAPPTDHKVVAGAHPREAPAAMRRYGCVSCHTIPGVRGADSRVGPPLTGFARRRFIAGRVPNEPETLVRWIRNPQAIKPGTAMPNLGVSDQEARNVAAYLYTLE